MKILHISDLHLGKRLESFSLLEDQAYILNRIVETIREQHIRVLLIAGDVYDKSVPPEDAVNLLDSFLSRLNELGVVVLMISGNHDSAERLRFGESFFRKANVHIATNYDNGVGHVVVDGVHFHLFPFARPVHIGYRFADELQASGLTMSSYEDMMRFLVEKKCALQPGAVNIAVVHQFVTANNRGPESAGSEAASTSLGGIDNIDYHCFDAFDYVALGHIHKPQAMGRQTVRYSGSILKYSRDEAVQTKSMTLLEVQEGASCPVSISTILCTPLRDLRSISCTWEELRTMPGEKLGNTDDYVVVNFTDEEDVVEAYFKARSIFQHSLGVVRHTRRQESSEGSPDSVDVAKSPLQLFAEFYFSQNGEPLTDKQLAAVQKLMEECEL